MLCFRRLTDNRDVKPVDTEDALKAGHCVDPDREMQLCALTVGVIDVIASKAVSDVGSRRSLRCRIAERLGFAISSFPSIFPTSSSL